ncbi:MAG: ABC transporter ATP-binding protein/permease [Lachnospiraceae bacterium]|nr:ABC transporter ATP-binding protein/permease [Lachnospiraceae bacterium]
MDKDTRKSTCSTKDFPGKNNQRQSDNGTDHRTAAGHEPNAQTARKPTDNPAPAKGTKPKDRRGTFLRLIRYTANYKYIMILALFLCLVSNVMALTGPILAGKAIAEAEAGVGQVNFARVLYYAKLMLIFYVASSLITLAINFIMMNVGRKIGQQMRTDVFNKLMKLPVRYFDQNAAGDIISHVSYDIDVTCVCISTDLTQIMTSVVTVVGSLAMMIYISPPLTLTMAVTIPLATIYTKHMSGITRPLFSRRSAAYGAMNGYVEEIFSGQKTVLAYAQENTFLDHYEEYNQEATESFYKANYYGMTMGPTVGSINNLGLALIGILGSLLYMGGAVTLEHISSFVLYSRKFSGPINEISNVVTQIFSALSAAERVFHILDETEEIPDKENAAVLSDVRGDVKIQDVSFGYDPQKTIIHHFSLDADAGKLIAIVGPTGAGKTTIINLLMRFYDVDEGQIFVDQNEIRDVTRQSLRRAYAMVLQDTWLFNGTIYENIAYGKEGATREEVIAVAKAAKIHHYIMQLPNGYDTIIGEDGGNISKGQKQLLTIARAMLYDARMLILDEATSNVDTGTERQIQAAMRELMADKTCFVIAHRLSTIQNADRILVVDQGNIVEQGTHSELIAQKGFYHKLYASQFE